MKIDSSHFETLEDLLDTIKYWYDIDEIDYDRWFGLEEMKILVDEIERLNNILKEVREYAKNNDNFFIVDSYSQPIVDAIQEDILEIVDKEKE